MSDGLEVISSSINFGQSIISHSQKKTNIEYLNDKHSLTTDNFSYSYTLGNFGATFRAIYMYNESSKTIDTSKTYYNTSLIYTNMNQEIDVILGGGKKFWPDSLILEYEKRGAQFIDNIHTPLEENKRVLGLFANKALGKAYEGRTPTTTEMAKLAIDILEKNLDGFFVMIEESQVDWGGHSNNADYIQGEMASLNELINYSSSTGLQSIINANQPEILILEKGFHSISNSSLKLLEIASNNDMNELKNVILNKEQIARFFPKNFIYINDNISDSIQSSKYGQELWRFFLYLIILLLIIEMILSNGKRFQQD